MYVNQYLGAVVFFKDFVAPNFVAVPFKLPGELKARTWRFDALDILERRSNLNPVASAPPASLEFK